MSTRTQLIVSITSHKTKINDLEVVASRHDEGSSLAGIRQSMHETRQLLIADQLALKEIDEQWIAEQEAYAEALLKKAEASDPGEKARIQDEVVVEYARRITNRKRSLTQYVD